MISTEHFIRWLVSRWTFRRQLWPRLFRDAIEAEVQP